MDIIKFEDTFEMAETITHGIAEKLEVSVVGNYTIIESLLKDLVSTDAAYTLIDVSLYDDDNEDDWVLEIDSNWGIYVYQFENGVNVVADLIFVSSDSNSAVIKACVVDNENDIIEFSIDEFEEECDGDCEHCPLRVDENGYTTEYSHDDNGELKGFTRSKSEGNSYYSESFYSTDSDLVRRQLNRFNY